jgi:hypothetical protein
MYRLVIAYLLAYDLFQLHLHPRKATHPSHHLVVDIVCGGFVWGGPSIVRVTIVIGNNVTLSKKGFVVTTLVGLRWM